MTIAELIHDRRYQEAGERFAADCKNLSMYPYELGRADTLSWLLDNCAEFISLNQHFPVASAMFAKGFYGDLNVAGMVE